MNKTCGSCAYASKHEEKGDIQRHWCSNKSQWMLSDCGRCSEGTDELKHVPHCSLCPNDNPGCLVCKAGVLRVHLDEGIKTPLNCSKYPRVASQEASV